VCIAGVLGEESPRHVASAAHAVDDIARNIEQRFCLRDALDCSRASILRTAGGETHDNFNVFLGLPRGRLSIGPDGADLKQRRRNRAITPATCKKRRDCFRIPRLNNAAINACG